MPARRYKLAPVAGYTAAVTIPVLITYLVASLELPAFVFEHIIVLLVVGVAIPYGLGPSATRCNWHGIRALHMKSISGGY